MEVPLLHLFLKHLVRLRVNEVLHDLLPLLQVDHTALEEVVNVKKLNDLSPVWFYQVWINLVGLLNGASEEISDELVHNHSVVLLLPFRRFLVVLEQLECHHEDYLHRFVRLLGVLSSDQVHKELVQYLLEGHDREEFGLDQHVFWVRLASDRKLYLFKEIRLLHVVVCQVSSFFHQNFHVSEDGLLPELGATAVLVLKLLVSHVFEHSFAEEQGAIRFNNVHMAFLI